MSKITSLLTSLFIILAALLTVSPASAKTIEVGENCTYQTIQAGINTAEEGDTILIQAGVYSIDNSIILKNNIELSGDPCGQTIIYTDSFSDCSSNSNPAMLYLNGVSGVTIHDIIFKGPATSLYTQHENGGTSSIGGLREARNGIKVLDSSNIKIYNCKFTLLLSDGIRISRSSNVQVKDCIIDCAGHDSISAYRSSKIKIDNCLMNLMINTCVRVYNSEDCSITNSTFKQSMSGTGAGYIELEGQADNVDINHNLFTASTDPVIFSAYSSGGTIALNDNALYGVENLRASYAPYNIIRSNNAVFSDSADFAALGYGYTTSSSSHIISLDEGKETHGEPEELEELEDPEELEELEDPEELEEIIIDCEDETSPIYENCTESTYLDFSISQAETSSFLINSSIQDLNKAKLLLNGTEEDITLAEKYIQAGNLKIKYAREFLDLSSQKLTTTTENGVL